MSTTPRIRRRDNTGHPSVPIRSIYKYRHYPGTGTWEWSYDGGETVPNPPFESPSESYMEDYVSNGRWHYNDCTHESYKAFHGYRGFPGPGLPQAFHVANAADTAAKAHYVFASEIVDWVKPLLFHDVTAYRAEELSGLFSSPSLPRKIHIDRDPFDTDFSIWYTLVDLISLKRFFNPPTNVRDTTADELRLIRLRITDYPEESTARTLANSHLATRFGWLPLVNDIKETIHTIKSWKLKYDQAVKLKDKRFRFHSKQDVSDLFSVQPWTENHTVSPPWTNDVNPIDVKVSFGIREAKWHGLTLYGFTCPELQGWSSRLAQIADSFGVLDPAAVWDGVPFSFIIDWFFTTQDWMREFKPRLFPATGVLYDYLESISFEADVRYIASWDVPTITSAGIEPNPFTTRYVSRMVGYELYSTYLRRRFRPELGNVTFGPKRSLSGLRSKFNTSSAAVLQKIAISASLLAQRFPR